jgi:hypothetical protein
LDEVDMNLQRGIHGRKELSNSLGHKASMRGLCGLSIVQQVQCFFDSIGSAVESVLNLHADIAIRDEILDTVPEARCNGIAPSIQV